MAQTEGAPSRRQAQLAHARRDIVAEHGIAHCGRVEHVEEPFLWLVASDRS
jgi:hypothetical protein